MNGAPLQASGDIYPWRSELDALRTNMLGSLHTIQRELLSKGIEYFDLSMINPDLAPPRVLQDRLVEASLQSRNHRYAVARGVRRLRHAFSEKYYRRFGVEVDAERQICVTLGAKDAAVQLFYALAQESSITKVLFGAPTYPAHLSAAVLNGLHASFFEMSRNEAEMLRRIEECLRADAYSALFLNFPNNPTGISVSDGFLEKAAHLAKQHGVLLVNDFVYGEMGLGETKPVSILGAAGGDSRFDGLLEIYSMSKAYNIPGWRVGAVLGDSAIVEQISVLKAHLDYGTFLPIQYAAAAALSYEQDLTSRTVKVYEQRCRRLVDGLLKLGWNLTPPGAGAFVWARIPEMFRSGSSVAFAEELLREAGVLVMPGDLFGEQFSQFVRFSLVVNEQQIASVLERLEQFHARVAKGKHDIASVSYQ